MSFHKRKKKYELNMDMADNTLQNILSSCNRSPNILPLNQIVTRQKVSTRLYERLTLIASVLLLLTFLLPLYIIPLSRLTEAFFTPAPVVLVHHYLEGDSLYLEFSGDNIAFEDAYMVTTDGETYYPLSYDQADKRICFPYPEGEEILFHIPVKNSQEIQLLLTPIYE